MQPRLDEGKLRHQLHSTYVSLELDSSLLEGLFRYKLPFLSKIKYRLCIQGRIKAGSDSSPIGLEESLEPNPSSVC